MLATIPPVHLRAAPDICRPARARRPACSPRPFTRVYVSFKNLWATGIVPNRPTRKTPFRPASGLRISFRRHDIRSRPRPFGATKSTVGRVPRKKPDNFRQCSLSLKVLHVRRNPLEQASSVLGVETRALSAEPSVERYAAEMIDAVPCDWYILSARSGGGPHYKRKIKNKMMSKISQRTIVGVARRRHRHFATFNKFACIPKSARLQVSYSDAVPVGRVRRQMCSDPEASRSFSRS